MAQKTIQVGIRTLVKSRCDRTVRSLNSSGINISDFIYETSKGKMGEVTNRLLDKMSSSNSWSLIIDDDITIARDVREALENFDCEGIDAIGIMPLPDDPKLRKYYSIMYSYYEKNNIEPMSFSFLLISPEVTRSIRIPDGVDAREEHAFYKEFNKQGFKFRSIYGVYVDHIDKNPNIDAKHNRWYAKGMSIIDNGYKWEALTSFCLSPIEGILYAMAMKDIFGLQHTLNWRFNELRGAWGV